LTRIASKDNNRTEVIRTWVRTRAEADATVKRVASAARRAGKGHRVHQEPCNGEDGGFNVIVTKPAGQEHGQAG
jgi:hypothetical protein